MRFVLALSTLLLAHAASAQPAGCDIQGPETLVPDPVREVRLGMGQAELERLLGQPAYSPIEGQFYFSSDAECPLGDEDRTSTCVLVADFRDYGRDGALTEQLQSCWWGAIGE